MKTHLDITALKNRRFVSGVLFVLASLLILPIEASASWVCSHGTSGQFQSHEAGLKKDSHFGYGLDINFTGRKLPVGARVQPWREGPGWIHFSIPTDEERFFSKVKIFYRVKYAWISSVHVWSESGGKVAFDNQFIGYGQGGFNTYEIDMGFSTNFSGANISIFPLAENTSASRMIIGSVCLGP